MLDILQRSSLNFKTRDFGRTKLAKENEKKNALYAVHLNQNATLSNKTNT